MRNKWGSGYKETEGIKPQSKSPTKGRTNTHKGENDTPTKKGRRRADRSPQGDPQAAGSRLEKRNQRKGEEEWASFPPPKVERRRSLFLTERRPPVTAIIANIELLWAVPAGHRRNIPVASLSTLSASEPSRLEYGKKVRFLSEELLSANDDVSGSKDRS
ncbi:hypothetical protein Pyn_40438 [Prunus yedoensis var. nudiflora]|uniref:Uncharacterized protein n=1 Tax=Prunus yedoensis var. nudiflora TaxID=2094558 RepID=A0A314YNH5_PRUYE|nr:hypothetical protein Pyn_40438 [Prunus yedoensis var. nudiflora]